MHMNQPVESSNESKHLLESLWWINNFLLSILSILTIMKMAHCKFLFFWHFIFLVNSNDTSFFIDKMNKRLYSTFSWYEVYISNQVWIGRMNQSKKIIINFFYYHFKKTRVWNVKRTFTSEIKRDLPSELIDFSFSYLF